MGDKSNMAAGASVALSVGEFVVFRSVYASLSREAVMEV